MRLYDGWNGRWDRLRDACALRGATDRWDEGRKRPARIELAPPASPAEVERVEGALRRRLPRALRDVVLEYSRRVCVQWQLREHTGPPQEFRAIFAGECRWDLEALPDLVVQHQDWLDNCFSDPTDDYGSVWYGKLPFLVVGNGDMVAIALDEPGEPVVYLSHDDGEGHGYRLGSDFVDYVERLSILDCPGAEDWQWLPFVSGPESGLMPESENGIKWRSWFGLD